MIDIISLLSTDGYIMCNKTLIKLYGSDCAILIGELCAEYNYYKIRGELIDDSFYSTQDNIEANTGLNSYYQRKAMKVLQDEGIISVNKKGIPAKNYYTINTEKLSEVFKITSSSSSSQLAVQALNINNNINNKNNNILSKDNIASKDSTTINDFEFGYSDDEKPKKKNLYQKCADLINEWTNVQSIKDLLFQYLNLCMEMQSIRGANQWKGMLNTLEKVQTQCPKHSYEEIIQASIEHGWKTFYPINDNYSNKKSEYIHIQKSNDYVQPTNDDLKPATNEDGSLKVF